MKAKTKPKTQHRYSDIIFIPAQFIATPVGTGWELMRILTDLDFQKLALTENVLQTRKAERR